MYTEDEIAMTLPEYSLRCLGQVGLSIRKVAYRLNISNTYISAILCGKRIGKSDEFNHTVDLVIKEIGADRVLFYSKMKRIPPEIYNWMINDFKILNYLDLCLKTDTKPYDLMDKVVI